MEFNVSLPGEDVEFLDAISVELELGLAGRSAALQRAVRALRESRLDAAHASAIEEWGSWSSSEWDGVIAPGVLEHRTAIGCELDGVSGLGARFGKHTSLVAGGGCDQEQTFWIRHLIRACHKLV